MKNELQDDLNLQLKKSALYIMYGFMVVAVIALLFVIRPLFVVMWTIFKPFAVAWVIAYMFNPIVNFIQQRLKLSRIVGLIVCYLLMILFVSIIFLLIIPGVVIQLLDIIEQLRTEFIPNTLIPFFERIHQQYLTDGWEWVQLKLQERQITLEELANKVVPKLDDVGKGGLELLGSLGGALIGSITGVFGIFGFLSFVLIINFYMLIEFTNLGRWFRILLPGKSRTRALEVLEKVDHALGGFLRGQFTVMCIVGVVTTALMFLIGLGKYAILIGFMAGIGNVIPYLGPVMGATPAVIYVIMTGDITPLSAKLIKLALVVISFMGVQALEGMVLQPKVVGKSAELHPLIVLLALLVGAQFGLAGMIIALPISAALRVVVKEFFWDRKVEEYKKWEEENEA